MPQAQQILDPCPEVIELIQIINALKHYSLRRLALERPTLNIAQRELDTLIRNTVRAAA